MVGIRKAFSELWRGMDDFQRYSLLAIAGLGGLLILLMVIFGIRDLVVRFL
jgi:hypothetical protein